MDAKGSFFDHGLVLKEPFHLSYPQVFGYHGKIFMIPESAASKSVWLYRAAEFPKRWVKEKILLNEVLVDTSLIIRSDGLYLMGTNRADELKIYYAKDLYDEFVWTEIIVTSDKAIARNAGRPLLIGNDLYRVAQNGTRSYGENICALKIINLEPKSYQEDLVILELFEKREAWMTLGYHHISSECFFEKYYVAVDGMRPDKFINNLSLALLKVFRG
jgi:hypothetical protein